VAHKGSSLNSRRGTSGRMLTRIERRRQCPCNAEVEDDGLPTNASASGSVAWAAWRARPTRQRHRTQARAAALLLWRWAGPRPKREAGACGHWGSPGRVLLAILACSY
jgi:hypothetical protein